MQGRNRKWMLFAEERVTRLGCILAFGKNRGFARSSPRDQHATGVLDLIFRACHREIKKKTTLCVAFFFMERVTRLELATSTLARCRSTG